MSADVKAFRAVVVDALNRMADVEGRLRAEASESGDEYLEGTHAHGEACLREAARAIEETPCE